MEFEPAKFMAFIRNRFMLWRGESTDSLADYAAYIGVSQQVMNNWYNGKLKNRPETETFFLLVDRYGNDVFDAVGLKPPTNTSWDFKLFANLWPTLSPTAKQKIIEIMRNEGVDATIIHQLETALDANKT